MSLKGQAITVNNINLNVVIEGEGRPIILLHGFPDSARIWRDQITFLTSHGFQVIVPDLSRDDRLTVGLNWYRANFPNLLFDDFPHVKVLVFGIWSSGDIFLSKGQMLKSAAYVDGPWRYEKIDGASHWIPLDVSERLNRLLLEYLESDP